MNSVKMSARLLFRAVVNERLTAAAEEIFQVFESTIAKYEEEASSSKQEIERLQGLLLESVSNHKTDFPQSSTCKEETPSEQQRCEQEPKVSVCVGHPQPVQIKEEDHELWDSQQHNEEREQLPECKDVWDPRQHQSPVCWEMTEQEDTKPSLPPQTHRSESEQQFQDLQETEHLRLSVPLPSTSQVLIQDGTGEKRHTASFTNQIPADQSLRSFIASTESADLFQLGSVVPEYHCHLCDESFSSNHLLINHAFHLHSQSSDVLCAVCGKNLESTESLSAHLKSHKGPKRCHVCGKHYNRMSSLTEHMASHAGVKLHRCHVCGKECSRKGDLKIHMRIHTGEKPFCCSFCRKSFTHSGHLKKHMRSHTGERPHRCNVCGKGFLQSTHLKYHLGTHAQKSRLIHQNPEGHQEVVP